MEEVDLNEVVELSINNSFFVRNSNRCGCYHCMTIFKAPKVTEWVDDGNTALCPNCDIDAVIPDSMAELTKGVLMALNKMQF